MPEGTATIAVPVNQDPDYPMWAAYWREMREEAVILVGEAFDIVAKQFAAGDARAAVDVLMFCSDESGHGSKFGIYGAIGDLLLRHQREQQAADEIRAGNSMHEVIGMVNTR